MVKMRVASRIALNAGKSEDKSRGNTHLSDVLRSGKYTCKLLEVVIAMLVVTLLLMLVLPLRRCPVVPAL